MLSLIFFRIQRQQEPKRLTLHSKVPAWSQNQPVHILNLEPSYLASLKEILASSFWKENLHTFWEIVPLTQIHSHPRMHNPLPIRAPVRPATMLIDAPMCLDNQQLGGRGCPGWAPYKGELRAITCLLNTY